FNFMGVDAAEYPLSRKPEEDARTMIFPASVVLKGIENTLFAVSTENVRPMMTGIFWDIHEEDITFVSSDTHKLVRYINREYAPGFPASFIMPAKPAGILKSIIGKDDADIKLTFDSKGAVFEIGDYLMSCLFIKGNYPNYNRVIPTDSPFEMTIDRMSLINALRRVCLFAAKSSNLVVLDLDASGVKISSQDLDYSTSAEEHVTCGYEGNNLTIGFNGQFMIEILSNLHDDTVVIKMSDPARPGVYTPLKQGEGEEVLTIQMPMQIL
ncbi:MAG: DNA polymerase III subunit beta, partial [Muribaculaceae bacterium]|nr:DNA polymerase III subunit beta [Muribaculaceae bacterium]